MQSDSDEGRHELTPKNINNERSSTRNQHNTMTPPARSSRNIADKSSIFANIDASYVLNILRH